MRRLTVCCTALVLAACAKSDEQATADSAAATPPAAAPAPAAPAPISLAAVAGKWNLKVMPQNADSTLTTAVLTTTADSTGWTMTFPGRAALPVKVTGVSGDSVMTEMGPYDAQLQKGRKVHTLAVFRMQGDKLVGRTTAHYLGAKVDTVQLRTEGTRAP